MAIPLLSQSKYLLLPRPWESPLDLINQSQTLLDLVHDYWGIVLFLGFGKLFGSSVFKSLVTLICHFALAASIIFIDWSIFDRQHFERLITIVFIINCFDVTSEFTFLLQFYLMNMLHPYVTCPV